nr:immunoglobulin light chain junction region [Macaca mulatta]
DYYCQTWDVGIVLF